MDEALRAGIAVYNAGHHHAAHDAWENVWLALPEGSDDERFLHGLIQFTAAVHHARDRNWRGAVGLCGSAQEYLDGLPEGFEGVNVATVREYLAALGRDPEVIERRDPPALTHEGRALGLRELDAPAAVAAAVVLAEHGGYDEDTFELAAEYAREGLEDGELNEFAGLLSDFAAGGDARAVVATRLRQHVQRRKQREEDVSGLFE